MKVVRASKSLFNPIALPGMGRSVEVTDLSAQELLEVRTAFAKRELFLEFTEEPGVQMPVKQIWANPHGLQVTLFV